MPTIFPIIINKTHLDNIAFTIKMDANDNPEDIGLQYVNDLLGYTGIDISSVKIIIAKPEYSRLVKDVKAVLSEYGIEYADDINN